MSIALLSTDTTVICRVVKALYDAAPGYTYLTNFLGYKDANGLNATVNALADAFSSQSNAELAATVCTNIGLTGSAYTAGVDYMTAQFNANSTSRGTVIADAMAALSNLTGDATFGEFADAYNATVATSEAYSTNTANTSTNISVLSEADEVSSAFTLTAAADAISGSSGDDSISSPLGTLSTLDQIDGGAGNDSLEIVLAPIYATAGSATAAAPTINGVETISITNAADTATFDFINVEGAETISVAGRNVLSLANMSNTAVTLDGFSSTLNLNLVTATASTAGYGMTLNATNSTALVLQWTADDNAGTAADVLTINAVGNVGNGATGGFQISGVEQVVLQGAGNVSASFASAATSYADLTAINGADMTGKLSVRFDGAANMNVAGGSNNDTFYATANFGTNDVVAGNGGSDVLVASLTGYIRPEVTDVETLILAATASAATADFRDVTGTNTVSLIMATGVVFDRVGSAVTTINVNSSDSTANDFTVKFGTAAADSDLTLNLGLGVMTDYQTAASTATTGLGIGTIAMSGNSGALTIITNSTAKYTAAAVEVKDFTTVTLNADGANLSFDSAVDIGTANTLNLTVAAGKTMTLAAGADLTAQSVGDLTVTVGQSGTLTVGGTARFNGTSGNGTVTIVAGASGTVDFSSVFLSGASTVTVDLGASALVTANVLSLGQAGATAHSGALQLGTIDVSGAGKFQVASVDVNGVATAVSGIDLTINATLDNSAAVFALCGVDLTDVASAASASEQDLTVDLNGSGSFTFKLAATDSSNVTYHINSVDTDAGTANVVIVDLSNSNDTDSVACAIFGGASGTYIGVDGVDTIEVGLGAMTVNGGLGSDSITFDNTAANYVEMSNDTVAGVDTVIGAGAGDVILFSGAITAAAKLKTAAYSTGTATTTAQIYTASFTAIGTATVASGALTNTALAGQIAIYTSNGDTIIEVLGTTAVQASKSGSHFLSGSNDFARVVLSNFDYTAITAAFKVDTTGNGVSITLL